MSIPLQFVIAASFAEAVEGLYLEDVVVDDPEVLADSPAFLLLGEEMRHYEGPMKVVKIMPIQGESNLLDIECQTHGRKIRSLTYDLTDPDSLDEALTRIGRHIWTLKALEETLAAENGDA